MPDSADPDGKTAGDSAYDRMLLDSILPEHIRPDSRDAPAEIRTILLTGATGFLGVHLLELFLRQTQAHIFCLARDKKQVKAAQRITDALFLYGIKPHGFAERTTVLNGDLRKPNLALSNTLFERLGEQVDAVYHCAAAVNWRMNYRCLRSVNVLPVIELLRLACLHKNKHFIYVSSISSCYSTDHKRVVRESDEALPLLPRIHLGYAQTKVVAETLVRQAGERGLAAYIHRPDLIIGNSENGISNNDDFFSLLIKGCIQMGCAPDLEWDLDACPVDFAAQAICASPDPEFQENKVFHLVHPEPRHWREIVLWMTLYGYKVRLLPFFSQWQDKLRSTGKENALYLLKPFFLKKVIPAGGKSFSQIYEKKNRSKINSEETKRFLRDHQISYPALNSALLDRFFQKFIRSGFLPAPPKKKNNADTPSSISLDQDFFNRLGEKIFGTGNIVAQNSDIQVDEVPLPAGSSIIGELSSWKTKGRTGLFRYHLHEPVSHRCKEVIVKIKPSDKTVLHIAQSVAEFCRPGLGRLFADNPRQIGLHRSHTRELAVYQQTDNRFKQHTPSVLETIWNEKQRQWVLVLEAINKPVFQDTRALTPWPEQHIRTAIQGLSRLHSIWYRKEDKLQAHPQLYNALNAEDMEQAVQLWVRLAEFSDSVFPQYYGDEIRALRDRLIEEIGDWWRETESMDRTLIHHDFNPRNIMINMHEGEPVLCAFDWELAAMGLPQRDLAELLCFVLPENHDSSLVQVFSELHRQELKKACGCTVNAQDWRRGLRLALFDILICRIPLYALVHRIKPQPFLPRVIKNCISMLGAGRHHFPAGDHPSTG